MTENTHGTPLTSVKFLFLFFLAYTEDGYHFMHLECVQSWLVLHVLIFIQVTPSIILIINAPSQTGPFATVGLFDLSVIKIYGTTTTEASRFRI